MGQILVALYFFLTGLLFVSSFFNGKNFNTLMLLSLPMGITICVFSISILVIFSIPLSIPSVTILSALFVVLNFLRREYSSFKWPFSLAYLFCFLGLSFLFQQNNLIVLSNDSFTMNNLAHQIIDTGRVVTQQVVSSAETSGVLLSCWGSFLVFIHSFAALFKVELFWIIHPLIGFNFFIFFLVTLFRLAKFFGAQKEERLAIVFVSLSLFSSYFMVFQTFYLHNSLISSFYLFIAVSYFVFYELEREKFDLEIALLSLVSFSLLRTEAPLVAAVFLTLFLSNQGWESTERKKIIFIFSLSSIVWYLKLLDFIGPVGGEILNPNRIMALIVPVVLTILLVDNKFYTLFSRAGFKYLLPGILISFFPVFAVFKGQHLLASVRSVYLNLIEFGYWGRIWFFIFPVFAFLFIGRISSISRRISLFIVSFFFLLILMSMFRPPYRLGWGDSANRMATHILPIMILFIILRMLEKFKTNKTSELANTESLN